MVSKDVTCPLHDNLLFSVSKLQKKISEKIPLARWGIV